MKLSEISFADEKSLSRLFKWQTRVGLAPKFGSRPIGWYQTHQCNAFDVIKEQCKAHGGADEFRVKKGVLEVKFQGSWCAALTASEIYAEADKRARV